MSPAIPENRPADDDGGRDDTGRSAAEPDDASTGWPYPGGFYPTGPVRSVDPPGQRRRAVATGAVAALSMIILGVPLGLIWSALAPGVPVIKTADGAILAQPQPEEFIAADGWFSLLGLGFGVLATIVVWLVLRRHRGPVGVVAVAVGGIGAAVLAWQVGRRVGLSGYHRLLETGQVGQALTKPPDLRAGGFEWLWGFLPTLRGDLLLPAFGAVVTYTLLAGWSRWASLRPEPEPGELSWDSPAEPTR